MFVYIYFIYYTREPLRRQGKTCFLKVKCRKKVFMITAEIHARSLANFYCQYADRHMNLKFMRHVGEPEPAIRQFVIVKNKLMSVFNASVLLLIMNYNSYNSLHTQAVAYTTYFELGSLCTGYTRLRSHK